jgi:hypothetical protein
MKYKGIFVAVGSMYGLYRSSGSHRLATMLREIGWDIEVVDFGDQWSQEELRELYNQRKDGLDFMAFSYIFSDTDAHDHIREYCNWIKSKDPDLLLIGGGQVPSGCQDYLKYWVAGYGEVALRAILDYEFGNGPPVKTQQYHAVTLVDAIHDYPAFPDRSSMIKYEDRDYIMPGEWGQMELSRGCKFKCKFCSYPVLGVQEDFCRTAESVYEQMMDAYERFGITNYLITDETFNDRSDKIIKFADVVERLPFKPYFSACLRADLIVARPQDRDEILRMGVYGHYHGIETFNEKAAKFIGKGMKPEKMQQGLLDNWDYFTKHAPKRHYRPVLNFIGGLPYETKESLENTYDWLKNTWGPARHSSATVYEINSRDGKWNNSYISSHIKELGYRELNDASRARANLAGHYITNIADDFRMIWENDNMNIIEAQDWTDRINAIHQMAGKSMRILEPSDFTEILCDDKGNIIPLEKKLILTDYTSLPYQKNGKEIFIPNYISKKLGL